MSQIKIVHVNESFDFTGLVSDFPTSGWACTISVKKLHDDVNLVSRLIQPINGVWGGFLTRSETAALPSLGLYRLIATFISTVTFEEAQRVQRFNLTVDWS